MSWKDEIIKSEKAKQMLSYILPFYDNDEYMMYIFESQGIAIDKLTEIINTFYDQPFPQRATWSVFYWEQLFDLYPAVGESLEERRKRLLTFLGSGQPITKSRMESIASTSADVKVTIEENTYPYMFRLLLDGCCDVDYGSLVKVVDDVKPAHLSYTIAPRIKEKYKFKEKVFVNLRRYHTVREFRVGMTPMMEQNEVAL